jgi:hypothetical protein
VLVSSKSWSVARGDPGERQLVNFGLIDGIGEALFYVLPFDLRAQ